MAKPDALDEKRAVGHLMDLLAVPGLSGEEEAVAAEVRRRLLAAGCREEWIRHDRAHERIPGDYRVGNLVVLLPGTRPGRRRLFMAHLDTVPLCRGARPVLEGDRIRSAADTGLGADDRTGVAALVRSRRVPAAGARPFVRDPPRQPAGLPAEPLRSVGGGPRLGPVGIASPRALATFAPTRSTVRQTSPRSRHG